MSTDHTALTELQDWCLAQAAFAAQQMERRTPDPGKPWDQPRVRWSMRRLALRQVANKIDEMLLDLASPDQ